MTMDRARTGLNPLRVGVLRAALVVGLAMSAQASHAVSFDWLFGKKDAVAESGDKKQRLWQLHEFTAVRITPAEAGATPNQQPAKISPEGLKQALESITMPDGNDTKPLFKPDEAAELVGPIAQALGLAKSSDDVVLLSTTRAGGFIGPSNSVTGRFFVQGGNLNFIADSTHDDFVDRYKGTQVLPDLTFGSRTKQSKALISSALGTSKRPDWLVLPMGAMPAPAPVPVAAPTTPAQRVPIAADAVAPAAAPAVVPAPVPAPAAAAAPAAPRTPAYYDEQEQRLTALKRLRDKGLITEEEYQQKRKEVLQGL